MGNTALAIDIGSNAIRCGVGTLSDKGALKILHIERAPVSIGRSVFTRSDRQIDAQTMQRAKETFQHFMKIGETFKVNKVRAVATSAMRDAQNSEELVAAAKSVGVHIEVISGDYEAFLVRQAVSNVYDISKEMVGILDIGGGSAEFSLIDHGKLLFSISERVGTLRLLQAVSEQRISTAKFAERIRKVVELLAQKVETAVGVMHLDSLFATGGNVEEIGKLRTKIFPNKKNQNKIRLDELETIIDILEPLSNEDRQKQFGFRADRADVIFPAAIMLKEILKRARQTKMKIPGVGLRDGLLLEMLAAE